MNERKLVIADLSVLPPVYQKVITVKELLESGQAETVNDAAQMADVSRSAYYKYKDYVFPFNQMQGIITLSFVVSDITGVLSSILSVLAEARINVLTINQNIPVNSVANVTISIQNSLSEVPLQELVDNLGSLKGVKVVKVLARQ